MARPSFEDIGRVNHTPIAYPIVAISILSIYVIYVVTTHSAFIYRALVLRDNALLERSVPLLTTQIAFGLIFTTNALVRFIVPNYPCFIELWLMSLGYLTWCAVFILFMFRYYFIFRSHERVAKETRVNPVTPENLLIYLERIREMANNEYWINDSSVYFDRTVGQEQDTAQSEEREAAVPIRSIAHQLPPEIVSEIPPNGSLMQGLTAASIDSESSAQNGISSKWICRVYQFGKARWDQLPFLVKYYIVGFGVHSIFIVVYLALITSLFKSLSISHLHYNCFSAKSFIPHIAFSGIFNTIIGPVYVLIIWRYKDAYGIRTSMCVILAVGTVFWAGILAWRICKRLHVRHISSSFPFCVQILIAHTAFVVIPLIKSIRYAKLKKRGMRSLEHAPDNSNSIANPLSATAPMELSKQSFFETMRSPEGHDKIETFAQACFCPELLSFVDVYVAFKSCMFDELKQEYAMCDKKQIHDNHTPRNVYHPPEIHIVDSSNNNNSNNNTSSYTSMGDTNAKESNNSTCHSTRWAASNGGPAAPTSTTAQNTCSNRISRKLIHSAHLFTPSNRDSATSESRKSFFLHIGGSHQTMDTLALDDEIKQLIQRMESGMTESMDHAFPLAGITDATVVPQNLRPQLSSIISTFVLPNSALEINLTAEMITAAQEYIDGADMSFGMLDAIKNHVVELLYANVYIRLYQEME